MQSISTEAWVTIALWRYGYSGVSEIPVEVYGQPPKPHFFHLLESQTSCLNKANPCLSLPLKTMWSDQIRNALMSQTAACWKNNFMHALLWTSLNLMWGDSLSGSWLLLCPYWAGGSICSVPGFRQISDSSYARRWQQRKLTSCQCRVKTEFRPDCLGFCPAELWNPPRDRGSTTSLVLCSSASLYSGGNSFSIYSVRNSPIYSSLWSLSLVSLPNTSV